MRHVYVHTQWSLVCCKSSLAVGVTVLLGTEVASMEQLSVEQAQEQLKQEHGKRRGRLRCTVPLI
jgi:hypothetical protein